MIQQQSELQSGLFGDSPSGPEKSPARKRGGMTNQAVRRQPIGGLGMKAPSAVAKNFVLDTNVLLHDPGCLQRFADNHVCIPVDVLSELDRFKNEQSERGANARAVHRSLMALFADHPEGVTRGVPTTGGGTVRLVVYDASGAGARAQQRLAEFHRILPDRERVDHRILACALLIQEANPAPVLLVTKDLNMNLKAKAVGLACEDYLNDKVDARDVSSYEPRRIDATPQELQRLASSDELVLDAGRIKGVVTNQYILLCASEKHTLPARLDRNGRLRRLHLPDGLRIPNGMHVKPLNLGQQCFLDAMLNPDISLVTCYGQAGTGKTLMAVAAGLAGVFERQYVGLTISRPIVAMGETVGFLPGTLEEKMHPWLQPIYDALEVVLRPEGRPPGGPSRKRGKGEGNGPMPLPAAGPKIYEPLLQQGIVEIEALCYIRGRSIPNRFFVLDEAQQLTPLEAKTIVTRMSRGSKLIMVGDPAQIDNPYVDSRSNGLVYTRKRMQGQPFSAHVSLNKGERSELAEAGAQLM
jgi:PhoH-like ATPase